MKAPIREPLVEGLFYPENPEELQDTLTSLIKQARNEPGYTTLGPGRNRIQALIVPNGSFSHCGALLGQGYAILEDSLQFSDYRRVIILAGAPHTESRNAEPGAYLSTSSSFRTPLGLNPVDLVFQEELLSLSGMIQADETAHLEEHGIEIQLPFIYYLLGEIAIVPLLVSGCSENHIKSLASAIKLAVADAAGDTLILLSTNMTRPGDLDSVQHLSQTLTEQLCNGDILGLFQLIEQKKSLLPVAITALSALCLLSKDYKCKLISRGSSFSVDGNPELVVEYACLTVE
jgi:AmmeMemoRadiSam system protein B